MTRKRRTFLRALGAGSLGLIAGCSGDDGTDTETEGDDGEDETDTATATATSTGTATSTPTDTATATATSTPSAQVGDGSDTLISIEAAGEDIWDATDIGHFFYAEVSGDFDARVMMDSIDNSMDAWAKGGLMVRPEMTPSAPHLFARTRTATEGDGFETSVQWRPNGGDAARSVTSDEGEDAAVDEGGVMQVPWQRLERAGDTYNVYASEEGDEWTKLVELTAGEDISIPADSQLVGLAATSHNQSEATTAEFRNLDGIEPTTNEDLDGPFVQGGVTIGE